MDTVDSSWIDEGHISYCQEDGKHYIFRSIDSENPNRVLTGADRWTQLDIPVEIQPDQSIIAKQSITDLTDDLAKELNTGALVYIMDSDIDSFYYNVYDKNKDIQQLDYLEDSTGWFRPLLKNYITDDGLNNTLESYATKDSLHEYAFGTKLDLLNRFVTDDGLNITLESYATKDSLREYTTESYLIGTLSSYVKSNTLESYATKDSLKDYVTESYLIGTLSPYATKTSLEDYVKHDEVPVINDVVLKDDLKDYVKQDDLTSINNQITTISEATGSIQSNLNNYKSEVDSTYTKKTELNNYVKYSEFQNNSSSTINRIIKVESDIEDINKQKDNWLLQAELDEYKDFVEETYAKPSDISSKLNTYAPNAKHENRWV